jgi:hypothetical protein
MRSIKNRPAIDSLDMPGLDNWLTDGGKVVSTTHGLRFTRQKHYYNSFNRSVIFEALLVTCSEILLGKSHQKPLHPLTAYETSFPTGPRSMSTPHPIEDKSQPLSKGWTPRKLQYPEICGSLSGDSENYCLHRM